MCPGDNKLDCFRSWQKVQFIKFDLSLSLSEVYVVQHGAVIINRFSNDNPGGVGKKKMISKNDATM